MKKKVAIFANGWSNEYLTQVLNGIKKRATASNIDLYTFFNYSSGSEDHHDNAGEKSIFMLPDLSTFDGVVLLTNTLNLASERSYLNQEVLKHNIPAVTLEYELEGIPFLGTDTYSGIYELTTHLIQEHQVKRIVYVSGPKDNQESQLRQKAVNDALATLGSELTENDILYGEWSYYETYNNLLTWLNQHEQLPDAFVCANDEMALGVYAALDSRGKRVPEHVIVTGCDCIDQSQKVYPILSTVARDWNTLGFDGLDYVIRQMDGEIITENKIYPSVPLLGESCGCKVNDERRQFRRRATIGNHKIQKDNSINEWHLRHIDDVMAKVTSIQDFKDHLSWNFSYNHSFEGGNFIVCLVEGFIHDTDSAKKEPGRGGYTHNMEVCLHLENDKSKPGQVFCAKDLLPPLDLNEQESNSFLFMPLHVGGEIIGYVVFVNNLEIVSTLSLYTWSRHVSQDLERVRQNIRLEELNKKLIEVSMTDALTGLKNRTGYDALAFPYLQKCQREGKLGSMIFADINRMKLINDKYGHLQGDIALKTVADAIKMTMPEGWIAVRFGGDEFIMIGECKNTEEAELIKQQLSENLEKIKSERDLCFPLSASFGAVVMNPEENYSLEEYLRKADEAMYVMKQIAHAKK